METLFIWLQHILPQHALSRVTGALAALEHPRWLKNWVIQRFIAAYDVNMAEAQQPDPTAYASFNAFFTRPLREGMRPLAQADVICPADGAISQLGNIEAGRLLQAKGRWFTATDLLGAEPELAAPYDGGSFATIYLAPRDYHRVHMPVTGTLVATTYVPGALFSVNQATAAGVDGLFARNERLVCHFDTALGPMAMVLVGAMVVAGIETVWAGRVAPAPRRTDTRHFQRLPEAVHLAQGEEMGRFLLGSTVILLFGPEAVAWQSKWAAGSPTRLGDALADRRGATQAD